MAGFVGAIDQGTTSTRFMIFDHGGSEVARHQLEHEQIMPRAGWVEHNPVEIWERTRTVIEAGLSGAGLTAQDLAAIGSQRPMSTSYSSTPIKPPMMGATIGIQKYRFPY